MGNEIIEFRYWLAANAELFSKDPNWLARARKVERESMFYSVMRLNSKVRALKQSARNLF